MDRLDEGVTDNHGKHCLNIICTLKGINSYFLPLEEIIQNSLSSPEGRISRDKA